MIQIEPQFRSLWGLPHALFLALYPEFSPCSTWGSPHGLVVSKEAACFWPPPCLRSRLYHLGWLSRLRCLGVWNPESLWSRAAGSFPVLSCIPDLPTLDTRTFQNCHLPDEAACKSHPASALIVRPRANHTLCIQDSLVQSPVPLKWFPQALPGAVTKHRAWSQPREFLGLSHA